MTRSQIFKKAHKEARAKRNIFAYSDKTYKFVLSICLKRVYKEVKDAKDQLEINAIYGDVDKYMVDALKAIKEGGNWNGTVYTKKRGVSDRELSVYVDGKYFGMTLVHKTEARDEVKRFENAVRNLEVSEKETSTKGLSYGEAYHRYGFDFAEEGNY